MTSINFVGQGLQANNYILSSPYEAPKEIIAFLSGITMLGGHFLVVEDKD